MNLIKTAKCLCCLMKCSKYIYYIKKAICIAVVVIVLCALCGNMSKCRAMMNRLRVM
jgi:hypothetical protein